MFDWKILAASFAALLVVSSILVGGFGFGDILEKVSDWMGNSPLDGFVSAPTLGTHVASVRIYQEAFDLPVEDAAFTSGEASFQAFTGTVSANLTSGEIVLNQKDTSFSVTLPLVATTIEDVSIPRLSIENTSFSVTSTSLETSGQGVPLDIQGFSGDVTINPDHILLEGNVTSIMGNGKDVV